MKLSLLIIFLVVVTPVLTADDDSWSSYILNGTYTRRIGSAFNDIYARLPPMPRIRSICSSCCHESTLPMLQFNYFFNVQLHQNLTGGQANNKMYDSKSKETFRLHAEGRKNRLHQRMEEIAENFVFCDDLTNEEKKDRQQSGLKCLTWV